MHKPTRFLGKAAVLSLALVLGAGAAPADAAQNPKPLNVLVLLGEWFGDAYFPLAKEIEARGWTMKRVGLDGEYRGCYNKKRDVVLKSDLVIKDGLDLSGFDALIIPSGPQFRKFKENPAVLKFVRDAHSAGLLVASFCVGNNTVRDAGLIDIPYGEQLFPKQVTLVKERVLLGPRGGGPPPGDGFESAPIKEVCDAVARELAGKPDRTSAHTNGSKAPLSLTYIANMGVLVDTGGTKVLIDALFDKPNPEYRAPEPGMLDKIMKGEAPFDGVKLALVTHNHPDHFAADVAVRFLESQTQAILVAPADAVADIRKAAADWPRIGSRITALDLKVGEKEARDLQGIILTACRTLHSGDGNSPMNLMYLFEIDGRRVWHEGDPNGRCEIFQTFGLKDLRIDLAVVHYWYPLEPNCSRFIQEDLKADHIALSHLPIRLESDAPGKIDLVRKYYKDIFLLLPGMPSKTLAGGDTPAEERKSSPVTPGMKPEIFAPGVVSREGLQMKMTMSADGSEILYTERDPATTAVSFIIRHRKGDSWGEPVILPLDRDYMDLEPSLCPDGKLIFFTSVRPPSGQGEPVKLPDIWMVEKTGDQWGSPVHLGPPVSTGAADIEAHPFIGPDNALYFIRQVEKTRRLLRAARRGSGFDEPLPVPLKEDLFAEQFSGPCLSPDGRILMMHSRKAGGFGNWDLYASFKDASGNFGAFVNLGPLVNTDKQEAHPSFSPDGRYLFFDRDGDIYRISAKVLEDLRPKVK